MKNISAFAFGLTIVLASHSLLAADAGPAIRALRKIEAAIETGVTYKEYLTLLAEVRLEQSILRDSMKAADAEIVSAVSDAWMEYSLAGVLWEQQISFRASGISEGSDLNSEFGQSLKRHCPNSVKDNYISLGPCKNEVWLRASTRTRETIRIARQQEESAKASKQKQQRSKAPSSLTR